jgi:hypothetical protein
MATRLYFRDLAWTGANNPPKTLSIGPALAEAPGSLTPRQMLGTAGSAQKQVTLGTSPTTAQQGCVWATFVSEPLSYAEQFTYSNTGTMSLSVADSETNLNVNHCVNGAAVFVFRPSTGAIIGRLHFNDALTSVLEPTSASSEQVSYVSRTMRPVDGADTDVVDAQAGDVLVVQIGAQFTQGMGTAYSVSFYFDGTTVNTTENAVVSDHASYIEFSRNIAFGGAPTTQAISGSLASSASGTGTLTDRSTPISGSAAAESATLGTLTDSDGLFGFVSAQSSVLTAGLTTFAALKVTSTVANASLPFTPKGSDGQELVFGFRPAPAGVQDILAVSTDGGVSFADTAFSYGPDEILRAAADGSGNLVYESSSTRYRLASPYTATPAYTNPTGNGYALGALVNTAGEFLSLRTASAVYLQRSSDGITWTDSPTTDSLGIGFTTARGTAKLGLYYLVALNAQIVGWRVGDTAWTLATLPTGLGITSLSAPVTLNGAAYAVATNNGAVLTTTNGTTWTLAGYAPSGTVSLRAVGTQYLIAVTAGATYHVSRDGGASWAARYNGDATMLPVTNGLMALTGTSYARLTFETLSFATPPMLGDLYVRSTATGALGGAGAYSPIFLANPMLSAASASADLTTAKGTKLYTDGPLLVASTATATLIDGPTQWIGTLRTRSSVKGAGLYFDRTDPGVGTPHYVLASGRWLASHPVGASTYRLFYSDDEGQRWVDTGQAIYGPSAPYFASNAAGTRIVSDFGFNSRPYYSDDGGKTWTLGSGANGLPTSRIVFGNGKFVRLVDTSANLSAQNEGRAQYSTDGQSWSLGPTFTDGVVPSLRSGMSVDAGDRLWYDATLGKFVALGTVSYISYPSKVATLNSVDGITWTVRTDVTSPPLAYAVGDNLAAMVAGVLTIGTYHSLDAGVTWTASNAPLGAGGSSAKLASVPGAAIMVMGTQATKAYSTTNGIDWDSHPIAGASAFYGPTYSIADAQDFAETGIRINTDGDPILATTRPVLTATGKQSARLLGAAPTISTTSSAYLGNRVSHALDGSASAASAATATTLIDTDPYLVTLRSEATLSTPALLTQIKLSGTLRVRSKTLGGGVTEAPAFYEPGNTVFAPSTGLVMSPSKRRDPILGAWTDIAMPDAQTPTLLASDGASRVCAFLSVGPKTAVTTDGLAWTVGTTIPAPAGGWASIDSLKMAGANGRFVLCARSGSTWYAWYSTDGTTWSAAQALPSSTATMFLFGTPDGFLVLFVSDTTGWVLHSTDGSAWTYWGGLPTTSTTGPHSYSGGVLAMTIAGGAATNFVNALRLIRGGGVESVQFSAKDANVPASYWFGDAYSSAPTFYSARTSGFDVLTDPVAPGLAHTYEIDHWVKPAALALTGDFSVFDGSLFGKAARNADSAVVGIYADTGPRLYSSAVNMAATAQGQASATARFVNLHALAGSTVSAATASGALTVRQPIAGTASAQASASAFLQVPQKFDAAAAGQATASASLTTAIRMVAAAVSASTSTAAATTGIRLAASVSATSTGQALSLQVPKPLVGTGQGAATANGALTVPIFLTGAAQARASASGSIATTVLLAAALTASASAGADLTVGSNFRGSGVAEASLVAGLGTEILLTSSVTSAAAATAALLTQISLESALTVESISEAGLDTSIDLRALIQATVQAFGVIRRSVPTGARANPLFSALRTEDLLVRQQATPAIRSDEATVLRFRDSATQARHTTLRPAMTATDDQEEL